MKENLNILVVDDEEIIRSLISDTLTDLGYNVQIASGGEEAIEKIKSIPFEILISDLKMPGMNGIEVIRKLKEINSDICIIVITGYPSIETALEALREGAYDYITKPFNLEEFKIIVRRAAEKKILQREKEIYKELSITDGLTGSYNRRYFDEILPRELNRASCYNRKLSLILVDIDDFKIYNDTNGHLAGDEVLKDLARLLLRNICQVDCVFRYGGEEFAILMPETEKEEAFNVIIRIRNLIAQTKFKYAHLLPRGLLTVSVGLAVYPDDAQSQEELISKADQSMYQAKRLGKNRACFFKGKEIKSLDTSKVKCHILNNKY